MERTLTLTRRVLIVAALLLVPTLASAATYYVDCHAAAGGDGSLATPWDAVADVNGATFSAGDSVLFNKGCTWRETLTVPSSGSAGNVITFGAYGSGAAPIIKGSDLATGWSAETGGGTENDGSTTAAVDFQGQSIYAFKLTTAAGGTLASYKIRMGASGPTTMKCALYSNKMVGQNYTPDQLIANTTSEEISSFPENTWVTLNVTNGATLSANTVYWLARWGTGANYWAGQGTTDAVWRYRLTDNTYPTFPTTAGTLNYDGEVGDGNYIVVNKPTFTKVYKATVSSTVSGALEDGSWMEPVTSIAAVDATANTWFWSSNVLYAQASDSSNLSSNGKTYEASVRNTAVTVNGKNYVTVDGLDLRHAAVGGLYILGDVDYVWATNCTMQYNVKNGFYAYEPTDAGHTLNHLKAYNCVFHHNGKTGLRAENRTTNLLVDSCTSHHNAWFHDAVDAYSAGIRVINYPAAGNARTSTGVIFQNNTVYSNGRNDAGSARPNLHATNEGAGLWFDTVGSGSIMRYNKSHSNEGSSGIHVEATDGAQVYYNLSYSNTRYGILVDTYLADSGWPSKDNLIYNNTFYGNGWSGIANYGHDSYTGGESSIGNIYKNNISVGNTGDSNQGKNLKCAFGGENVHAAGGWGSGNVFLNNSLGAEASDFVRWGWDTAKATYDAWESAYGATTTSVEADPLMVSASNFRLQAASPAINAGVDVSLTSDFTGRGVRGLPDIGAYEFAQGGIYRIPSSTPSGATRCFPNPNCTLR